MYFQLLTLGSLSEHKGPEMLFFEQGRKLENLETSHQIKDGNQ